MNNPNLFSPIEINGLVLPNRIIMSPMFSNSAGPNGVVSDNTIKHYVDRARSEVGLIMTEHTSVSSLYIHPGKRLQISDDLHVAGLKRLVDAVHQENCKIGLQIAHSIHGQHKKPSDLTNAECYQVIDDFVEGARRAKEAGFDAIELHYAHTYTMADFLSKRTNTRNDEFGGDIYGRMFMHIEILKKVRALVGPNYPLFARFSAEEFVVGGNTLVQTTIFAQELEKYGIDCLDVSVGVRFDDNGLKGYSDQRGKPTIEYPDGPNVYCAEHIKKHVSVPIITVGKLGNPIIAKEVIEQGRADMVALARPLIADSMWVKKVKAGRDDLLKSCLYCNECLYERFDPEAYVHCMRYTCQNACPANAMVPVYLDLAYQGKYLEAYQVIQAENPLVIACGRVCDHNCETYCNRQKIDDSVAIKDIKRLISDQVATAYKSFPLPKIEADNGQKVALIGAGPSSLSCAFYLRKKGYAVTVFEQKAKIGGMMQYAIPEFRLPKTILDLELELFSKMGIEFKTNCALGQDISIKQLQDQGYQAIYLGIGATNNNQISLDNSNANNIYSALDFLELSLNRQIELKDKNIIVIGGGNVALDVARTAARAKAKAVKLYCLEQKEQMPAHEWEIVDALKDRVLINNGWGVEQIIITDNLASGLKLKQCTEVFIDGKFKPTFNENNQIISQADIIVFAIGQHSASQCLAAELPQILASNGQIKTEFGGYTAIEGIFSGGDCSRAPQNIVQAVQDGKLAAASIDSYLGGDGQVLDINTYQRILAHQIDESVQAREKGAFISIEQAKHCFSEADDCLTVQQMQQEVGRCLRCDVLKMPLL